MQETQVRSLGQEDPLEEGMATHSSILACRIPWTEEPGRLQSPVRGGRRVRHNWARTHAQFPRQNFLETLNRPLLSQLSSPWPLLFLSSINHEFCMWGTHTAQVSVARVLPQGLSQPLTRLGKDSPPHRRLGVHHPNWTSHHAHCPMFT